MKTFEELTTYFEGDSRILKTLETGQLIGKLKPTIFSLEAQGPIPLPGIEKVRTELNAIFCRWLHLEGVKTSTLETVDDLIYMSQEIVAPIEVVVKSALVGSPKHVYKGILGKRTRFGHFVTKHEPYVRFDWRNPLPESDHCMPEGLADQFIDTGKAKKTALRAFEILKRRLQQFGMDLVDICFFMNEAGDVICGEVSCDNSQIIVKGFEEKRGKQFMLEKAEAILGNLKQLTADVIVGGYLGDEGKGKLVGGIGSHYDAVFRVNASTNAGHCVSDGVNHYVTRQLPSVFFPKKTDLVIAPGALLNLVALEEELRERPDLEDLYGKFKVASSVSLVLDPYLIKDRGVLGDHLGSTRQGTGPSAAARAARHSLRLFDLKNNALEKIKRTCEETLPDYYTHEMCKNLLEKQLTAFHKIESMVGPFCIDYSSFLAGYQDKHILIEGCNGLLLDNLHGMHPYVTSASTNIGALMCGANLSPCNIGRIIIVIASYATCLGQRPFPTEMDEQTQEHFFQNCNEIDVAEFKKRRIGWLDIPALKKALVGAKGAVIHMNKLDVLTGLSRIQICTHYTIGDERYDMLPDDPSLHDQLKPHYIVVEGWNEPIGLELPLKARRYVEVVQSLLPNSIVSLGVGPNNGDLIHL